MKTILLKSTKEEVIEQLLSLDKKEGFTIRKEQDKFLYGIKPFIRIYYTGGYNGVWGDMSIVDISEKPVNEIYLKNLPQPYTVYYWKFKIMGSHNSFEFETSELDGSCTGDFVDFFVDSYIKEAGNILNQNNQL